MYKIEVDVEKCIGCGDCVDICPVDVYEIQDEKVSSCECRGMYWLRKLYRGLRTGGYHCYRSWL